MDPKLDRFYSFITKLLLLIVIGAMIAYQILIRDEELASYHTLINTIYSIIVVIFGNLYKIIAEK